MKSLILILITSFSLPSLAAICPCDAEPSCGPKAPTCLHYVTRLFVGSTFVKKGDDSLTSLRFANRAVDFHTINVAYGSPLDGMPFGTYQAKIKSENRFDLILNPFGGGGPLLIDQFNFDSSGYRIEVIRTSHGVPFLLKQ